MSDMFIRIDGIAGEAQDEIHNGGLLALENVSAIINDVGFRRRSEQGHNQRS